MSEDITLTPPGCDWHQCPNTAVLERRVTFKVKGESVYRQRTLKFCRPHDDIARRTGRFILQQHPDDVPLDIPPLAS